MSNAGSQQCSLCRQRRRPCDGTCEYAQYFPGHRFREFENAYRLFGVHNMLRILRAVEPHERQAAANSMLVEATAWTHDPVHGVLGLHSSLSSQIDSSLNELQAVNRLLDFWREQHRLRNQNTQGVGSGGTTQVLSSGEIPSFGGDANPFDIQQFANLVEPLNPGSFPGREQGESSAALKASEKGKMIVEDEDAAEARDKGKQIIIDDDPQEYPEVRDKGKQIAYEEDPEAEDKD